MEKKSLEDRILSLFNALFGSFTREYKDFSIQDKKEYLDILEELETDITIESRARKFGTVPPKAFKKYDFKSLNCFFYKVMNNKLKVEHDILKYEHKIKPNGVNYDNLGKS